MGYAQILPKIDYKDLPFLDDVVMIKKWMNRNIHLWKEMGYRQILPKMDYKDLRFLEDLVMIKKWMNGNIQLWMIVVPFLCIIQIHPNMDDFGHALYNHPKSDVFFYGPFSSIFGIGTYLPGRDNEAVAKQRCLSVNN